MAFTLVGICAHAQTPATLVTLGTTAPVPGGNDVAQLSTSGQIDMPDSLNYYTDNQSNHSAGEPGQTFTTGASGTGYLFRSLAIKTGGGTTSGTSTPQNYLLHIYAVTNGVATVIATYLATNFTFTDGDWLNWSGFSLSLATNSVYAYSFGKASSAVTGWEAMGNASGNLYSKGELGLLPVAGGTITFGSSHAYDAVFDVGLAATGPTVANLTNSPATGIFGKGATLNGTVTVIGASIPLVTFYYGPANGGTNASAWSNNIATGPQTGNFAANVAGLNTNTTYYFTAQASNNIGISWAAPAKNFITPTITAPSVTNQPASAVAAVLATLNGLILNTGNEPPTVRIYYGTNDGGSNPAAWTNQATLGPQSGGFGAQVAGLTGSTTYYFTTSVSNSSGVVNWGGPSKSFTTLTLARVPVLTYHYDNTRQGQNTNETVLTPSNVNVTNFGQLFSYPVDGYVYAQPLIVNGVNIPGRGVRNVVFVATEHDSVYAFDADSNGDTNGGLLWKTNLGIAAISPSTEYGTRYHAQGNTDLIPEEGATGTPVIDPVSGTIYLDAFSREVVAGVSTNYFHRLHALNITNGNERSFSPVVVSASVPGTGVGGDGTRVTFAAVQHLQRPALTLAGGLLYVCYGSHGDSDPYHGWVMGYNPATLVQLTNYLFNTTPNGTVGAFGANAGEGALWMGGNGLIVDANTNLYFQTGNGSFSQNTNGGDYGDCFMKLSTTNNQLAVADYFTPYNQAMLQANDEDLGSGGPLLLPDNVGSAAHPHLIVGCGKEGKIYLVDRDNMGHYNAAGDSQIVQYVAGAVGGTWCSPAYFNHLIFYQGNGDVMKAFLITNGVIVPTPVSASTTGFGFPGATPMVTANGTNNGIAWITDPSAYLSSGPAVLHAYNATNLAQELYNSSMNLTRDNPGGAVKMTVPVASGGKVYVGAEYALSVYGNSVFVTAPVIAPNGGTYTNSIAVTISDATVGASIYYTLDGSVPGPNSTLYTGPIILTNNTLVQAMAAATGAVNSSPTAAGFINTSAIGNGSGLLGAYYGNHTPVSPYIGAPTLTRTDAVINFDWNTVSPDPSIGLTGYTIRWTGTVQPQFSGNYTFSATADDGVRLWVNGQKLVEGWVDEVPTTYQGTINLNAQQLYNIEMDYYQDGGGAEAMLAWSSPAVTQAIIPQTQLYPFTNPPPTVVMTAPTNSATNFTASASVTVSAEADAPNNPIAQVSFYANTTLLGSVSNAPYTLTATSFGTGTYSLTAVAVDGSGLCSTSAAVNITVNPGSGQPYGLTNIGAATPFLNLPGTFNGALPPLLSLTGVFSNTPAMTVAGSLIPYTPNTPLWSDNALKTRYFMVPNNGGSIAPNEQISFAPTGSWTFPAGTIFVKTFQLNTDTSNTNVLHRLETRLLVRDINGAVYGVTYKWRPDNSDADLLTSSLSENILITNSSGVTTQSWYYPSPADCLTCHTPVANYVLGLNTRQLNGNQTYPATGVTDNQLRALNRAGLFNPAFNEANIPSFSQLSAVNNLAASLTNRFRSYIDANCAQCHQPGGTGPTFDARYDTPLAAQNIIYGGLGPDNVAVVVPQDIWRSKMYQRTASLVNGVKMPPLAKNTLDTNALAMMTAWINGLTGTPAQAPPTITPDGGSFLGHASIALQAPDTSAAIYFTLDGTLPTTNSLLYPGSQLLLSSNATLTASAFRSGYNNSLSASAVFTIQPQTFYFIASGFLTNRQFQMSFAGLVGSNYVLEATTNFTTWTPLITNLALTNLFNLVDPKATNFPRRFYRMLQQ